MTSPWVATALMPELLLEVTLAQLMVDQFLLVTTKAALLLKMEQPAGSAQPQAHTPCLTMPGQVLPLIQTSLLLATQRFTHGKPGRTLGQFTHTQKFLWIGVQ
jgi:hypothetical protein